MHYVCVSRMIHSENQFNLFIESLLLSQVLIKIDVLRLERNSVCLLPILGNEKFTSAGNWRSNPKRDNIKICDYWRVQIEKKNKISRTTIMMSSLLFSDVKLSFFIIFECSQCSKRQYSWTVRQCAIHLAGVPRKGDACKTKIDFKLPLFLTCRIHF